MRQNKCHKTDPPVPCRDTRRVNYDRMSNWYDLFASSEQRFTQSGLLLLDAQPGEHILEIGFGTGHALVALARRVGAKGSITGLDISSGMLRVTRKRLVHSGVQEQVNILLGDAVHLPHRQASFEAILMSFTLELFDTAEIPAVLGECRRVLRKGGRMAVIALATGSGLAVRAYEWGHRRFPSLLDCRPIQAGDLLPKAGFKVTHFQIKRMWGLPVEILLAHKSK